MTTRMKLPKGWRWAKLGDRDVSKIGAGNSAPQGNEFFDDGIYPFVRTQDVGREGETPCLIETADRLNDHAIQTKNLRLWPESTILIPKSGASTFLNHRAMLGCPAYVSSHLATVVAQDRALPDYLYFLLLTIDAKDIAPRNNYPSLRLPDIAGVDIPLPSMAEQERIVEVLRQADAIRRKRAEARRLADQILPALFLDMFGDPITNPKNWPVDRLGNHIADWQAGFASGKKEVEGGVRQLRMNNITTSGWINLDLVRTVTRHKKHEHYLARRGDVIFNNTNSPDLVGKTILFLEEGEFYFSNHLSRIRTTERVTNEWLAGLLHALWTKDVFKGLCRQWVNQASVSKESVFSLEVPIPSPTALQNHQEALEYVSTRRDAFAISHEDAERLFSVLLSRAFTGELTAEAETEGK